MRRFAQGYKDFSRDRNGPAETIARYHMRRKMSDVLMPPNAKSFDATLARAALRRPEVVSQPRPRKQDVS
jgi:hypothetical protein